MLPPHDVSVLEPLMVPMHGPCPAAPVVVWMHTEPPNPPSGANPPPRQDAPPPAARAQSVSNWHEPPGCTLPLLPPEPEPELELELEKTLLHAGMLIDMFEQDPACWTPASRRPGTPVRQWRCSPRRTPR